MFQNVTVLLVIFTLVFFVHKLKDLTLNTCSLTALYRQTNLFIIS